MCGIAGVIQFNSSSPDTRPLVAMAEAIRHRGPDDVGFLFGNARSGDFALFGGDDTPAAVFQHRSLSTPRDHVRSAALDEPGYNLGLASRRLAIIDLSPAGHQPMCNEDRSLWIVFNGEIYSAPALRAELAQRGHRFASASDTETILHAYEEWGDDCVTRLNGMWALALWDIPRRRLFLARDRVGIKPLYFWHDQRQFAFASEIKGLLALGLPRRPNHQALHDFLAAGITDHADMTFFEGILSLLPASAMSVDLATGQSHTWRYWGLDLCQQMEGRSDQQYAEAFHELFVDAVRAHLVSDRPVGTCLSGGLDSSALVCVINKLIREDGLPVVGMETRQKTFSARYEDPRHDEGRYITAVVRQSSVDAHTTFPTAADLRESWEALFYHLEEPFGSTSIFAQWCVFKLAHEAGITVTLDGQGSDELLAGYFGFFPFYFGDLLARRQWSRLRRDFRAHTALHGASAPREAKNIVSNLLPGRVRDALKRRLLLRASWLDPAFMGALPRDAPQDGARMTVGGSRLARALYTSLTVDPLPAILRYDDRNSMAHAVESRVPFLDHRLIEFCFALPTQQKIRDGVTKYILREAMRGIVPEEIRQRHDKIRFSTPEDAWLRGELLVWAREVLDSPDFRQRPYFRAGEVLRLLADHAGGRANHERTLWRCLAVELWHRAMRV